jgi:hypothetical protein
VEAERGESHRKQKTVVLTGCDRTGNGQRTTTGLGLANSTDDELKAFDEKAQEYEAR